MPILHCGPRFQSHGRRCRRCALCLCQVSPRRRGGRRQLSLPVREVRATQRVSGKSEGCLLRRDEATEETGNSGQTVPAFSSSVIAWMVPDPKPGWSTQKVSAPVPLGTAETKICESLPSGTISCPFEPHCRAPVESSFCP